MRNFIRSEKALGLVEALLALAVVGTGMVLITYVSLKTIKQARKNELQDVAIQTAVEAMDFMKDPATIRINGSLLPAENTGTYYKLNFTSIKLDYSTYPQHQHELEAVEAHCNESSYYIVSSLVPEGYTICQQIHVTPEPGSSLRFDIEAIVVWKSVAGGYEKRVLRGYRLGRIQGT